MTASISEAAVAPDGQMPRPFPWRWVGVNVLAGVLSGFVAQADVCALIGLSFLLTVVTAFQAGLWRLLGRNRIVGTIFMLLPTGFLAFSLVMSLPIFAVPRFLDAVKLAPLPASAHHVRHYRWSSGMAFGEFASFQADPKDIEDFLKSSAVRDRKPVLYSAEHPRVRYSKTLTGDPRGVDFFVHPADAPSWWNEEIRGRGRLYSFSTGWGGYVIYNEETRTVYIRSGA